ncbi:hypothetical protein HKX48_005853 [Thoreauomyces humboldtii]|nr:hypothetical protein HKX48_005853 [Thoreauomyces humboldtii]
MDNSPRAFRLCKVLLVAEVFADICLVDVLGGPRRYAESQRYVGHGVDYHALVLRRVFRNAAEMWLRTWFPYKKGISPVGFTQILYFAYWARCSRAVMWSLNLSVLVTFPRYFGCTPTVSSPFEDSPSLNSDDTVSVHPKYLK